MNPILSILRAAHCRSTHHYFAIDALPLVQTAAGKRLASWLVRYHDQYLTGAKDPDTRFRDFQNHVVHVNDGYWGGAPRVAHRWYDRLQRYLREGRYDDAAHAAGVISHYFTDPIQPLHTAQTPQEKVLHRPIEWSITTAYDQIYQRWLRQDTRVLFRLSEGPEWLGESILHAAKFANRRYDPMVSAYRLDRGAKDPPTGFGEEGQQIIADLFGIAITGWSRVIERMALETELRLGKQLPTASTSVGAVLACVRVPARLWMRRIVNKRERAAIADLVEEFTRTGDVVQNLSNEVDVMNRVVKIHADERAYRAKRIAQANSPETTIEITSSTPDPSVESPTSKVQVDATLATDDRRATIPFPTAAVPTAHTNAARSAKRPSLRSDDPLVDAPSIGPKTAKRFKAIAVHTVADFLGQSPEDLAKKLATRWMSARTIADWQAQAELMCNMPRMLARDVQLLVGAGYDTVEKISATNVNTIQASINKFAGTSSGRRYLRGADVPTAERIGQWQTSIDAPAILTARSAETTGPTRRKAA